LRAKKQSSFFDLFNKFIEVHQVSSNFFNWQINEHTSDLRGFLFSCNLFHKLKDSITNLTFVVRIVWMSCWDQWVGLGHVLLVKDWNLNVHLWHRGWSSHGSHWLRHHVLWHSWHSTWWWHLSWLWGHSHLLSHVRHVGEWLRHVRVGHHHLVVRHWHGHSTLAWGTSLSVVVVLEATSATMILIASSSVHVHVSSLASLSVLKLWLHE